MKSFEAGNMLIRLAQTEKDYKEIYRLRYFDLILNYNQDQVNHEEIDKIAEELGVSVDCVATTPGLLNGVTLKFPTDLVTYYKVEDQENQKRVA